MQHWAFASAKGLELRIDEIAFECNFEVELHERGLSFGGRLLREGLLTMLMVVAAEGVMQFQSAAMAFRREVLLSAADRPSKTLNKHRRNVMNAIVKLTYAKEGDCELRNIAKVGAISLMINGGMRLRR
ncbi:MAG: hypothetical protein ACTS6P_01780 [Candidatus Hodgkinia cicadicola]